MNFDFGKVKRAPARVAIIARQIISVGSLIVGIHRHTTDSH